MKKTVIFLMRHGEVKNPKQILYGRLPKFGLTESGKKKVLETAKKLAGEKIDFIYASPLKRTLETAKIVSKKLGIKPKFSRLIIEIKLIFEGIPLGHYKSKIQPYLYSEENYKKGQESIDQIYRRMKRFLDKIIKDHKGKKILVISHGDPIGILKAKLENKEFTWKYKHDNYLLTGEFIRLTVMGNKYHWG